MAGARATYGFSFVKEMANNISEKHRLSLSKRAMNEFSRSVTERGAAGFNKDDYLLYSATLVSEGGYPKLANMLRDRLRQLARGGGRAAADANAAGTRARSEPPPAPMAGMGAQDDRERWADINMHDITKWVHFGDAAQGQPGTRFFLYKDHVDGDSSGYAFVTEREFAAHLEGAGRKVINSGNTFAYILPATRPVAQVQN